MLGWMLVMVVGGFGDSLLLFFSLFSSVGRLRAGESIWGDLVRSVLVLVGVVVASRLFSSWVVVAALEKDPKFSLVCLNCRALGWLAPSAGRLPAMMGCAKMTIVNVGVVIWRQPARS